MTTTIKVKYNTTTTLVEGYFPTSINYPNNVIDEVNKTIDGSPYIEVTSEEHQDALGKTMCVVDDAFIEYVKTDSELLAEAKSNKKAICKSYLNNTDWQVIRKADSGEALKDGVSENRNFARDSVDIIEAFTSISEVESYDVSQLES